MEQIKYLPEGDISPTQLQRTFVQQFLLHFPSQDSVVQGFENEGISVDLTPLHDLESVEELRPGIEERIKEMGESERIQYLGALWKEFADPKHLRITESFLGHLANTFDMRIMLGINKVEMKTDPNSLFHHLGVYDESSEGIFTRDLEKRAIIERIFLTEVKIDLALFHQEREEARDRIRRNVDHWKNDIPTYDELITEFEEKVARWEKEYEGLYGPLPTDSTLNDIP